MILEFISYDMKNEADGGSFPWECSTRGPQKILSMGFYCSEDPQREPLKSLFFRFADSMIEEKRLE